MSPDGAFRFKYSDSLVRCKPAGLPNVSSPEISCTSYFPICDDDAIVCIAYPAGEYTRYNFGGGAFSVTVLQSDTELQCLTHVDRNTCQPLRGTETHNGVKFRAADCAEGGLGHYIQHETYRAYYAGKCYQLSINIEETQFQNYDTGTTKEFSRRDREKVVQLLRRPLDTFSFRK